MSSVTVRETAVTTFGGSHVSQPWPLVPLRDVCEVRTGVRNPEDRPDEPFQFVDISAVDNERKRIIQPQRLIGRNAPSRARNVIRTSDVLVSTTRPNLNAVAMVPPELDDQICSTGFCVLRAGPRILCNYLFAFVRSNAFVEPLATLVQGALYPAVNDKQVLASQIPLPPLSEQERIAGRLTEQLAAVERARAAATSRA
jgi:type I restriction enzyme S subunit